MSPPHAAPVEAIEPAPSAQQRFDLDRLSGRLTELCADADGAALSCAFGLLLQGQLSGEPVAYVGGVAASFFPPDAATGGIDLDALVVIRAADPGARARAAAELARSGAFSIIVIDLLSALGFDHEAAPRRIPPALVSRLMGLAQKHATAVVFVSSTASDPATEPVSSAIGSLVSLRAMVRRRALDATRYVLTLEAIKDKRGAPGWTHSEICRGAEGLC